MFARGDKYERQLVKAGIAAQPAMRLAIALDAFQAAKPVADKTFANFRPFIQREFTKRVKHDKTSAKYQSERVSPTKHANRMTRLPRQIKLYGP